MSAYTLITKRGDDKSRAFFVRIRLGLTCRPVPLDDVKGRGVHIRRSMSRRKRKPQKPAIEVVPNPELSKEFNPEEFGEDIKQAFLAGYVCANITGKLVKRIGKLLD